MCGALLRVNRNLREAKIELEAQLGALSRSWTIFIA
ncbi:hypothetical protein ACVWZK_002976 [Bradyrhizobium sp. GM0.4]